MRINEIVNESQLNELDWKKLAAAGALSAAALGAQSNPMVDHPKVFGQPAYPSSSLPVVSSSVTKNDDGSFTVSYNGNKYQTIVSDNIPTTGKKIIIPMIQLGIKSNDRYIGTIEGDKIYIPK